MPKRIRRNPMSKQQRKDLKTFLTAYKSVTIPICAIAATIMGILLCVNTAADKTAVYALALLFLSVFALGIEAFITDKQNKQLKNNEEECSDDRINVDRETDGITAEDDSKK